MPRHEALARLSLPCDGEESVHSLFRVAVFATALSTYNSLASAYDINLGPLGHACDTCGGGVIGGLPVVGPAIKQGTDEVAGDTLAEYIQASRNTAINGAIPIPPLIRQSLTGYATEDSINRVRFKIGDNGFFNLARVLERAGKADAVTLIDVIVFNGPTEAGDPALWAHELTHVDQYRDWGLHSFAVKYVRNFHEAEDPAYAKANGFVAWTQQHQQGQYGQNIGSFCFTYLGRFGPGPPLPIGSPCNANTPQGMILGQIVP